MKAWLEFLHWYCHALHGLAWVAKLFLGGM